MISGGTPRTEVRQKYWPKLQKSTSHCSESHPPIWSKMGYSLITRINMSQSQVGNYCDGDQQSHHIAELSGNPE